MFLGHLVVFFFFEEHTKVAMLRKELLDARKALRSAREGVSGPRSKKQRGEWEQVSMLNICWNKMVQVGEGSHCSRGIY